jgi:hypothetical protein
VAAAADVVEEHNLSAGRRGQNRLQVLIGDDLHLDQDQVRRWGRFWPGRQDQHIRAVRPALAPEIILALVSVIAVVIGFHALAVVPVPVAHGFQQVRIAADLDAKVKKLKLDKGEICGFCGIARRWILNKKARDLMR